MGRDWSKQKRRKLAIAAHAYDLALNGMLHDADPRPPSKADQRAEAERLLATYRGDIKRLATVMNLTCPRCKHRGAALVPKDAPMPRFRCKRCKTLI